MSESVELDPSVADWLPDCVSCGKQAESWADVIGLAASVTGVEDDEPGCLVFAHRSCPSEGSEGAP